MTLTAALSIALSGLQVATSRLQIASNNISNASDPSYTKKDVTIAPITSGTNAGGAYISGYTRATDRGLTASYNNATSDASYYSTQNQYLQQVQSVLNSTSDNPALSDAVAKFQSAWTEYASAPESSAQQASLLQASNNLASQIRAASAGVLALNRQVVADTTTTITTLNSALSQIADLNQQIAFAGPESSSTGNLMDKRDQLINQVASITNVYVMERPQGQIALYTPQGVPLVDNAAQSFSFNGASVITASGRDVTDDLKGGMLQAQVDFLHDGSPAAASSAPGSEVIRKLNSQLTALTEAFTGTTGSPTSFAAAYNSATTNSGELASSFFTVTLDGNGDPIPSTIAVNANLLNNTSKIKQGSVTSVMTALAAARSYTADGLTASGTYANLATSILSNFQQAANSVKDQSATATAQQTYYQQSLSNATGVNVDDQLVQLTALQNSYAASAHVISTINQMLETLTSIL